MFSLVIFSIRALISLLEAKTVDYERECGFSFRLPGMVTAVFLHFCTGSYEGMDGGSGVTTGDGGF